MTRRHAAMLLTGLASASALAQSKKPGTSIHEEVDFKTTPSRVYQALLDAKQFSTFTALPAEIQPLAGAPFKLFGGQIEGRNIELVPDQRIVQAWRPTHWSPGLYSIARFELAPKASGMRIVFDHVAFPEGELESLTSGWHEHYWGPLHKYLNA